MVSAGSVSNPILLHLCYSAQSVALMLSGGILLLRSSLIILAEGPVHLDQRLILPRAAAESFCVIAPAADLALQANHSPISALAQCKYAS